MESIAGQSTQAKYVDALTIHPFDWEDIEVAINDAPVMMQLYELDEHRGGYQGGDWKSEILVDPATLTLSKVGGARFRTNPATPTLAGSIFAIARNAGDPVVSGLQPRKQLSSIFGPTIYNAVDSIVASAPLKTVFSTPVPGAWSSLVLHHEIPAATLWHGQAQWYHGTDAVAFSDFWFDTASASSQTSPGTVTIALPVLGDSVTIVARHASGGAQNLTTRAYLTNLAPYSIWGMTEWKLIHLQALGIAGAANAANQIPLYAGPASFALVLSGPANQAGNLVEITGFDEAGTVISYPLSASYTLDAAGIARVPGSVMLCPHRNQVKITAGVGAITAYFSLIANR